MKIDWEKDRSKTYEPVPEGVYKVRIQDIEYVTASTGTKQIRWRAEILEGDQKGSTLIDHTPLTTKALWKVANLVYACSVDVKGQMELDSKAFAKAIDVCKGRSLYWNVTVGKDNNGVERNNIKDYKRNSEVEVIEFSEEDKDDPTSTWEE